jgi:RNA polymerase sigma factor (sigma-70 family)
MRAGVDTVTPEHRVRQIRAALDSGDRAAAERHFAALLEVSTPSTERWLRHVVAVTPALHNASAYPVRDDLRQELALFLWDHIAARHEVAWEHTYWRALLYGQKHVATGYMHRAGYWTTAGVTQGWRGVAIPLSEYDLGERLEAPDVVSAAESAGDLHAALMRLPARMRAAVVLRYWRGMGRRDIASALGCHERTVQTLLRQATERLGRGVRIE